jgi:ubiquinone/menaquinone biosynthesis C-methylase UbiE
MLTRFLIHLCAISPFARRLLWRWWYERLAKRIDSPRWIFMNYGLAWPETEGRVHLAPEDEPDRYCAQLYHRVAAPGALKGKEVLEVGSGRGGGAAFVARHHQPAQLTGVDFSAQAVAFATKRHRAPHLRFQVGDAEKLPFADASFDAVINVESSHCYGSMESFLREVARVLRPGGVFLFADLREAADMESLETLLVSQPALEIAEREDITPLVAAALKADHQRKRALIAELIPARQRAVFEEFAGLEGSQIQRTLEARTLLYHRFVLRRKTAD